MTIVTNATPDDFDTPTKIVPAEDGGVAKKDGAIERPPAHPDGEATDAMASSDTAPASIPDAELPPSDTKDPSKCMRPAGPVEARLMGGTDLDGQLIFDRKGEALMFHRTDLVELSFDLREKIRVPNLVTVKGGSIGQFGNGDFVVIDFYRDRLWIMNEQGRRMFEETSVPNPWAVVQGADDVSYLTSNDGYIYSASRKTGKVYAEANLRTKLRGLAFSVGRKQLIVGTDNDGIWTLPIVNDGRLGNAKRLTSAIQNGTVVAVDECDGIYVGGDSDMLRRINPDGSIDVVARVPGWRPWWMAFGSGKLGWSERALYMLDDTKNALYEIPVGVREAPAP